MDNLILYDDNCNLCLGSVRFVKRHDKKKSFGFIPLNSGDGKELIHQSGLMEDVSGTIIYYSGGNYFVRSSAVLHIFKDMGGAWQFLYCFIIIPAPIRDFFYRSVAKYRYRIFGRKK